MTLALRDPPLLPMQPLDPPAAAHPGAMFSYLKVAHGFGRGLAESEGMLEPQERHQAALAEYARSLAHVTTVPAYDSDMHAGDREREMRHRQQMLEAARIATAIRVAAGHAREAAEAAAGKRSVVGPTPKHPLLALIFAVFVISLSLSPALHDIVYASIGDDLANWMLSLLSGGAIGAMITAGFVSGEPASSLRPRAALYAGAAVGIGFALLRMSVARHASEVLFALALTGVEFGVLFLLDHLAAQHRAAAAAHHERERDAAEAAARAECRERELARLAAAQREADARIQAHLEYLDERTALSTDLALREQALVQAALAGYMEGIARNVGRTLS